MGDLESRVSVLQKNVQKRNGFVEKEGWYNFRVAPTCPPSLELRVRGGKMASAFFWEDDMEDWEYRIWTVPNLTADLADVGSVLVDVIFVNANYFQYFLLCLATPIVADQPTSADWRFYLHGTRDEFETSAEAEAWLHSTTFQESNPLDRSAEDLYAYPLCGIVLKNNGIPGAGCQVLPVDYVNRGRSYIWPTDMRALTSIYD